MSARKRQVIHASAQEVSSPWTSEKFRAMEADAINVMVNQSASSGGTVGYNLSLLGYDLQGASYLIYQTSNYNANGKRTFAFGQNAVAGQTVSVPLNLPYEFAIQINFDFATINFYAEMEVVTKG